MIQSLLTKETPEIIRFFRSIDSLSEMLDKQEEKLRPVLNGERYITDCELAEQLKLTRRTLAEYRINGKLPYYKIGGKLLYKEKDILAGAGWLKENHPRFAAVFFRQALHNQGKRQTDAYKKRNTGFTKAGHV